MPQKLFALILTPTRELAFQIGEQFEALGVSIGVLVGQFIFSHTLFQKYLMSYGTEDVKAQDIYCNLNNLDMELIFLTALVKMFGNRVEKFF